MSSDWDEIRRLAADLQRAQLSSAAQRLSERNCVEIVSRLVSEGRLEVVHTADGKEYLTPQQLQREIRDELAVARGRVALVDLAQALNVDFSHVEAQAQTVARQDGDRAHLVLGQLVGADYLDTLCEQVNEQLQLNGTVSIPALTKEHDLPSEFINEEVGKRLGGVIEGFRDSQDPRIILTPSYVQRNRAKIRGALSAVTVPTAVADVVNRFKIQEHLFFSLAEELIATGRIRGSITGGKRAAKAVYNPAAYAKAQTKWVDDFLAQNGYVEYEAVGRLGISDPAAFLKKRYADRGVHFLPTCCVGAEILDAADSAVEEAVVAAEGWIDVAPLLPSVLSEEDGGQVLQTILSRKSSPALVLGGTVAVARSLVEKVRQSLEDMMPDRAKKDLDSRKYEAVLSGSRAGGAAAAAALLEEDKADKKEERRKKAATGKGGGGTQGRETKTKSTKKGKGGNKRNRGGDDDWPDSDDEHQQQQQQKQGKQKKGQQQQQQLQQQVKIEFMTESELEAKIGSVSQLSDCPEEVFSELAAQLHPALTRRYRETLSELHRSTAAASMHDRSKAHSDLQDRCNAAISHVRLFEKGLVHFDDTPAERKALERHLLKTQCADLANALFAFHLESKREDDDGGTDAKKDASSMTAEDRVQVIKRAGAKEEAEALLSIHKALGGDDAAAFVEAFEENAQSACDVFVRKSDKKRDRQLVFAHRHSLLEKLQACRDPALAIHLTLLILFQQQFNCLLHASGKFVPAILNRVAPSLEEEDRDLLQRCQELVVRLTSEEGDDERNRVGEELDGLVPRLAELAAAKKKGKAAAGGPDE